MKRYKLTVKTSSGSHELVKSPDGEWYKHEDVFVLVEAINAGLEFQKFVNKDDVNNTDLFDFFYGNWAQKTLTAVEKWQEK